MPDPLEELQSAVWVLAALGRVADSGLLGTPAGERLDAGHLRACDATGGRARSCMVCTDSARGARPAHTAAEARVPRTPRQKRASRGQ